MVASVGRRAQWIIGIAAGVVVLGTIGNLTDGGSTDDTAAQSALTTASSSTAPSTASPPATTSPSASSPSPEPTPMSVEPETPPTTVKAVAETTLAPPPDVSPVSQSTQANPIVAMLATIPVKGRAPKTGYDRDLFGAAWTDDVTVDGGHNGCDTRNDILRRDLTNVELKAGSNGCTVLTGILHDLYTGKTIDFVRGQGTSTAVQIDHVVALSDAWQKGAQQIGADQRKNFANDPLNLQAVDGPTNEQKGDGDAATWLPPNKAYRCTYVSRQVQVKAKYKLWVTSAEHGAILRVLATCGATVPTTSKPPTTTAVPKTSTRPPAPRTTALPPPTTSKVAPPPPEPVVDVYYSNCSDARAAGAAPLYVGDPGYRTGLDRDHDGIACE